MYSVGNQLWIVKCQRKFQKVSTKAARQLILIFKDHGAKTEHDRGCAWTRLAALAGVDNFSVGCQKGLVGQDWWFAFVPAGEGKDPEVNPEIRSLLAVWTNHKLTLRRKCLFSICAWCSLTISAEDQYLAPGHGAVDRSQCVVADHDKAPHGQGQGQPNRDVVNDGAELCVEPDKGCPAPW